MSFPPRPIAFVLASTNHGNMIVNRNDYRMVSANSGYGVGYQILNNSCFDPHEVNFVLALLDCRRRHYGDNVVAVDGGANIGVHTIEWARHMTGWGQVVGFEAQEIVYYALAGNVVLNNCLNARVRLAALGETCGELEVPQPNYFAPASFGSLELQQRPTNEFIGQQISYEASNANLIPMVNLDALGFDRLDLVKIDVEGMEVEVLKGGRNVLSQHHPIMIIEVIKSDRAALDAFLVDLGYQVFSIGINLLAVHSTDPTLQQINYTDGQLTLNQ
jgi:FkbM family methyltransferase